MPPYLDAIRRHLDASTLTRTKLLSSMTAALTTCWRPSTAICSGWPQLKCIRHPRNLGKGAAVRTGVLAARGDHILFADADGATPIEEEQKLRRPWPAGRTWRSGSRLTADSQVVRHRTWRRAVLGRAFAAVARRTVRAVRARHPVRIQDVPPRPAQRLFALSQETGLPVRYRGPGPGRALGLPRGRSARPLGRSAGQPHAPVAGRTADPGRTAACPPSPPEPATAL